MARAPDAGDLAPDFTLASTAGDVTLSERLRERAVLLVFYPGDDTPVCTAQLCDYRDHLEDFAEILRGRGLNTHVRRSRGDDIAAACGQLVTALEETA